MMKIELFCFMFVRNNYNVDSRLIRMKKFYRANCEHCGRHFTTNKLLKMEIESTPEIGMKIEIDLANVIQNNYHYEVDTLKGKAVIDLKDIGLDITCPHCKRSATYSLRKLVVTDRLD